MDKEIKVSQTSNDCNIPIHIVRDNSCAVIDLMAAAMSGAIVGFVFGYLIFKIFG